VIALAIGAVLIVGVTPAKPIFDPKTTQSTPAEQMLMTSENPYILPSMDLLRVAQ
jgi:hypothetical protein